MKPAIVIAAYDRSHTLKRLLKSIDLAAYPSETKLIISIDKNDSNTVYACAEQFNWRHGEKVVIKQKEHLGLRKHIMKCGRLSKKFGSIILLEDDLFVSPKYYEYANHALEFYKNDERIAGISLYAQQFNETARMGFVPIDDGSDIFFLQIASSWGQCWTAEQWEGFESWYNRNGDTRIKDSDKIPHNVTIWPDSSWKKLFIRYMVDKAKYFVYPRRSFTTNFHDVGTHHVVKKYLLQVPLELSRKQWAFKELQHSISVYDAFYEIEPRILNNLTDAFLSYDYTVDLYGQKKSAQIDTEYILRPGNCDNPIMKFSRELKSTELNIIYNIEGDDILFGRTRDFALALERAKTENMAYYFSIPVSYLNGDKKKDVNHLKILNEEQKNIEPTNPTITGMISRSVLQALRYIWSAIKKRT